MRKINNIHRVFYKNEYSIDFKELLCVKYYNGNKQLIEEIGYYNNGNLDYHYKFKNNKKYSNEKEYLRNYGLWLHKIIYNNKQQGIQIQYEYIY